MAGKLNPIFAIFALLVVELTSGTVFSQQPDAPKEPKQEKKPPSAVQMPVEKTATDDEEAGPRDDIQSTEPDAEDADPAEARNWRELARASEPVRQAFKEVITLARSATVQVRSANGDMLAMGTIVNPDGFVLTKASEMRGDIVCHLSDGRELPAKVFGIHLDTDLALLKIDEKNLPAIAWEDSTAPLPVGSWLVTPDTSEAPIAVGVVSVVSRKVSPGGVLGVFLEDDENGVRIDKVIPDSPADKVDIRVNDIVIEVNGEKTETREKLVMKVKQYGPGDRIEVVVLRGENRMTFRPVLGRRAILEAGGEDARSNIQNRMGSSLSQRRTGFTAVIQHDTMLAPNQCGGVVVDIDGKAVGVNIARSGRIMSYALPSASVLPILTRMLAGELSPETVNKTRLQIIRDELADLDKREILLPDEHKMLETEVEKLNKTVDELKNSIRESEEKLKAAKAELEKADAERNELSRELRSSKRSIRRIESTRQQLKAEQDALKKGTFPEVDE